MIEDEDSLFLFLQYGGGSQIATPTGRPVFNQSSTGSYRSSRGSRSEPYFGTFVSDPRPTKEEGKKALEFLSRPFRIITPFAPPLARPILVGAPRLAEILIEIDPQERYRD